MRAFVPPLLTAVDNYKSRRTPLDRSIQTYDSFYKNSFNDTFEYVLVCK